MELSSKDLLSVTILKYASPYMGGLKQVSRNIHIGGCLYNACIDPVGNLYTACIMKFGGEIPPNMDTGKGITILMSLELFNPNTLISRKYSRQFMEKAFELARLNGWKPMGTRPPVEHNFYQLNAEWLGTYLTNDGQIVNFEDALSLANALEKTLDDIPDINPVMDWNPKFWIEDELPEWLSPEERAIIEEGLESHSHDVMDMHPFEFFAGEEKQHLTEFIRFCRLGSFAIL